MGFKLQISNEKFFNITHKTFTTPVPTSCKHFALWILKLQTCYPIVRTKRRHPYIGDDISYIQNFHYMTLRKRSASLGYLWLIFTTRRHSLQQDWLKTH